MNFNQLAKLLLANHGRNVNGCLVTEYRNIPGLTLLATSTNGTSGIGVWCGRKVYWSLNSGFKWNGTGLDKVSEPQFEVVSA